MIWRTHPVRKLAVVINFCDLDAAAGSYGEGKHVAQGNLARQRHVIPWSCLAPLLGDASRRGAFSGDILGWLNAFGALRLPLAACQKSLVQGQPHTGIEEDHLTFDHLHNRDECR